MGGEQPARPGTLYVVATPIGNLRDIGLRALDVLRTVDRIAAEDTRVAQGLLSAYGIAKPLTALHEHNEATVTPRLIARLQAGESLALVSDAGTPGVSDPGAHLVREARAAGLPVVPIPGASAVTTILSVAGTEHPHWLFYGFLPARPAERRKVLQGLAGLPYSLVFYEAPHRIVESVADMASILGGYRQMLLARELTKRHEQVVALPLDMTVTWLQADPDRQRGEFVLLVTGAKPNTGDVSTARQVLLTLLAELPASQAARLAARLTGLKRAELYALALALKPADDDQP